MSMLLCRYVASVNQALFDVVLSMLSYVALCCAMFSYVALSTLCYVAYVALCCAQYINVICWLRVSPYSEKL